MRRLVLFVLLVLPTAGCAQDACDDPLADYAEQEDSTDPVLLSGTFDDPYPESDVDGTDPEVETTDPAQPAVDQVEKEEVDTGTPLGELAQLEKRAQEIQVEQEHALEKSKATLELLRNALPEAAKKVDEAKAAEKDSTEPAEKDVPEAREEPAEEPEHDAPATLELQRID